MLLFHKLEELFINDSIKFVEEINKLPKEEQVKFFKWLAISFGHLTGIVQILAEDD